MVFLNLKARPAWQSFIQGVIRSNFLWQTYHAFISLSILFFVSSLVYNTCIPLFTSYCICYLNYLKGMFRQYHYLLHICYYLVIRVGYWLKTICINIDRSLLIILQNTQLIESYIMKYGVLLERKDSIVYLPLSTSTWEVERHAKGHTQRNFTKTRTHTIQR